MTELAKQPGIKQNEPAEKNGYFFKDTIQNVTGPRFTWLN